LVVGSAGSVSLLIASPGNKNAERKTDEDIFLRIFRVFGVGELCES
jgi:hypothetical protein